MSDAVILLVGDGERDGVVVICHGPDGHFEPLCDHVHMVIGIRVGHLVAHDGLAQGNGGVDLCMRGEQGLKDCDSDSFDLIRGGRGETREDFLNLAGSRGSILGADISFECQEGAAR